MKCTTSPFCCCFDFCHSLAYLHIWGFLKSIEVKNWWMQMQKVVSREESAVSWCNICNMQSCKKKGEMGISIGNACQGILKIRQRMLPARKPPRFMGESWAHPKKFPTFLCKNPKTIWLESVIICLINLRNVAFCIDVYELYFCFLC